MNGSEKLLSARLTELVGRAQPLLDAHDNEGAQALVGEALALDPGCTLQHPANVFVLIQAALLALRRNDNEQTARLAISALTLANALGDPHLQAHAHLAVARASFAVGNNDHTLAMLEATWPLVRDGDDLTLRYWYQTNFAIAHADLDQSADAKEWYQQAAATAQALGIERLIALATAHLTSAWLNLADTAHDQGDEAAATQAWQTALDTANKSLPLIERAQVDRWVALARLNRCVALGALGQADEALVGIAQVHSLAGVADWPEFMARVHYNTAKILYRRGELSAVMGELKRGEVVGMSCQARSVLLLIHEMAGKVAEQLGDLVQALESTRRHHALYVEIAIDKAAMRSKLLSVRLETERAQAEAQVERNRRIALSETNVALAKRAESLHHDANFDTLTSLPNRRHLDQALAVAHADAVASHKHLCLALLDIDHFKAINDQHSHIVGDRVLKQLGSLLSAASRGGDLAARFGGEEFVVVMGNVTPAQAVAVAERLRQSIQEFEWANVAPGLQVTASFGVCDIAPATDPVSGLTMADKLLYQAKQQGRNRVAWEATPSK